MKKFSEFILNIQKDKLLHFAAGFFSYLFLQLLLPATWALILTGIVAIAKEVIWDWKLKKGTPEIMDAVYGILAATAMYFLI